MLIFIERSVSGDFDDFFGLILKLFRVHCPLLAVLILFTLTI